MASARHPHGQRPTRLGRHRLPIRAWLIASAARFLLLLLRVGDLLLVVPALRDLALLGTIQVGVPGAGLAVRAVVPLRQVLRVLGRLHVLAQIQIDDLLVQQLQLVELGLVLGLRRLGRLLRRGLLLLRFGERFGFRPGLGRLFRLGPWRLGHQRGRLGRLRRLVHPGQVGGQLVVLDVLEGHAHLAIVELPPPEKPRHQRHQDLCVQKDGQQDASADSAACAHLFLRSHV